MLGTGKDWTCSISFWDQILSLSITHGNWNCGSPDVTETPWKIPSVPTLPWFRCLELWTNISMVPEARCSSPAASCPHTTTSTITGTANDTTPSWYQRSSKIFRFTSERKLRWGGRSTIPTAISPSWRYSDIMFFLSVTSDLAYWQFWGWGRRIGPLPHEVRGGWWQIVDLYWACASVSRTGQGVPSVWAQDLGYFEDMVGRET